VTADAAQLTTRSEASRSDDINMMSHSQAEVPISEDAAFAHNRGSGDVISVK
jgi:hypothetical protein